MPHGQCMNIFTGTAYPLDTKDIFQGVHGKAKSIRQYWQPTDWFYHSTIPFHLITVILEFHHRRMHRLSDCKFGANGETRT